MTADRLAAQDRRANTLRDLVMEARRFRGQLAKVETDDWRTILAVIEALRDTDSEAGVRVSEDAGLRERLTECFADEAFWGRKFKGEHRAMTWTVVQWLDEHPAALRSEDAAPQPADKWTEQQWQARLDQWARDYPPGTTIGQILDGTVDPTAHPSPADAPSVAPQLREAAQAALDWYTGERSDSLSDVVDALRAALANPKEAPGE